MSSNFSLKGKKVFVAGHNGMVGSALIRRLKNENCQILTANRNELDLRNQQAVQQWFLQHKPEVVFLAAAKVGGVHANRSLPADFIYDNLTINSNVIHAAKESNVAKLLYLGSSCIYPRDAAQPMREEALLTGPLESTNQWYAIAKIAGLKMVEAYRLQYGCDFISCMPTNLYGPNDNYDLNFSHVLPALLRKTAEAKRENQPSITIWGTGLPKREFLYVDDLADASVFLMQHYSDAQTINVGVGHDLTIKTLAETIAKVLAYKGHFTYDSNMPDGTPQKVLDITRLKQMGWEAKTDLITGIQLTYQDFTRRYG